jgi:hypothetical protein
VNVARPLRRQPRRPVAQFAYGLMQRERGRTGQPSAERTGDGGGGTVAHRPQRGDDMPEVCPPREEVLLLRDEIANLGWAAELRVEAGSGRPIDRGPGPAAVPPTPPPGDAWRYTMAPSVPGNLLPLLPVNLAGESGLFLQRGRLPVEGAANGALGQILTPGRPLLIEDGQVPTSGVRISGPGRWPAPTAAVSPCGSAGGRLCPRPRPRPASGSTRSRPPSRSLAPFAFGAAAAHRTR